MDSFTWSVRIAANDQGRVTAFVRRHQFEIGAAVQFDEEDKRVSALEYVLGAIGADLVNGMKLLAQKRRVDIYEVEAVVQGELNNALTHLGVVGEKGHPGLQKVVVNVYVSSTEQKSAIEQVWDEVLKRSPLVHTLKPTIDLQLNLKVVI